MISSHGQRTAPHCHYSNNSHSPPCSKLAQLGVPPLYVYLCIYLFHITYISRLTHRISRIGRDPQRPSSPTPIDFIY